MPTVLFVNACVRGNESRTYQLSRGFFTELSAACADLTVIEHNLQEMHLTPVDRDLLIRKERLCDASAWDDPLFAPARDLCRADAIVVAAPYWDLSFPSMLKVWVENIYVRNLTFRYENDQPIGLCKAKECVYLTTAGSKIGIHDWGHIYMRDVMHFLGVRDFSAVHAEELDIAGADVNNIMMSALVKAIPVAQRLAYRLQNK